MCVLLLVSLSMYSIDTLSVVCFTAGVSLYVALIHCRLCVVAVTHVCFAAGVSFYIALIHCRLCILLLVSLSI